jgi:zinc protease
MVRASLTSLFVLALFAVAMIPGRARGAESPQVVALQEPQNPLVAFRFMFRTGSVDDPAGQEGITALAATLMAEGGTEKLTSAQLLEALFPMAAELSVRTDKEVTIFSGRVHKDHLDRYLEIMEDVVLHPRWDSKEFDRLRDVQLSDIQNELRSNDDEELGKEALEWLLYKGHPYGHPVAGTVTGVKSLDLAKVRAHASKVFTSNRLTIGLAGGFPNDLPKRLETAFAKLPTGAPPVVVPEAKPAGARVVIVEKEAPATAISMGYPYPLNRRSDEFVPFWVGVSAFGEHRQSGGRLFQALREKRGLNYGNYAYAELFRQEGWGTSPRVNIGRSRQQFSIWIRPVEHQNRVFAIRNALWEVDKLLKSGLSDEEIERTKGFLDGYTRLWEMTTSRRLGFALDDAFNGTDKYLASSRARMKSLDAATVNAELRQWIDPSKLRFAVVTTDAQAMKEALTSGKPSPIEYPTPKSDAVLAEDKEFIGMPLGLKAEDVMIVKAGEMFEM